MVKISTEWWGFSSSQLRWIEQNLWFYRFRDKFLIGDPLLQMISGLFYFSALFSRLFFNCAKKWLPPKDGAEAFHSCEKLGAGQLELPSVN